MGFIAKDKGKEFGEKIVLIQKLRKVLDIGIGKS